MTGRDGFSSDDLLRQARKAIERRDGTDDEEPQDQESRSVPLSGTPLEPRRAEPVTPPPYEPYGQTPAPPPRREPRETAGDDVVRPTDRIATGTATPTTRRPAVTIGILMAVFGVGAAIFVAGLFDDSTAVEDVGVGTCLNDPGGEVVTDVDPISCDEPHEFEMIGSVKIPGESFPGDETFDLALERCVPLFEDYVGIAYADSIWWLNAFTPTEEGWDQGDRVANCLVFQFDADRNILPVTGSARGAGR
jgi:hypothetical protein